MRFDSAHTSPPSRNLARPGRAWTVALALLGALAALCLLQLACRSGVSASRANGAPANRQTDRRLIEVDGTARLDIPPDRVDLHLTLSQESKRPREAAHGVQRQREGLLTALKMLGLSDKQVVTSYVSLQPRYARYGSAIEGYTASQVFIVKIPDPKLLTAYVEAAAVAGVTRLHTRFRHSRMQDMKRRVREMALQAARAKAEQIARVTGVAVGQVRTVRETPGGHWTGSRWGWGGVDNFVANNVSTLRTGDTAPARPDAIRLHLSILVTYAIRS